MITHASLFSGIGGFDLAAEWVGWSNLFHCEKEPFCQQVLKFHFPNSIAHNDITKTDFTIYRNRVTVLTGGFPCQPYSVAGARKGTADERHLWPQMLRAIREIQPTWIVGENVLGLVNWNGGLVFHEVQTDLETEGYEVQPFVLPAASQNAPHKRQRVWFVAYSESKRSRKLRNKSQAARTQKSHFTSRSKHSVQSNERFTSYASKKRLQRDQRCKTNERKNSTRKTWVHRPTSKLYIGKCWQNFPTQSPICSGNDGLSGRLDNISFSKWRRESIKAYGNAVVPQVVYQIFKVIDQMHRDTISDTNEFSSSNNDNE